ncbi:MAG: Rrf2 family transcriptional regulator [Hyphomicrobiales bacterium]|nr:Rrf2 family transcriptional regulator [Hyphomicrobiales bacterium]
MRLTTYTDYALRVLIYLGLRGGALATIQEIADQYGISKNHLMKLVHQLGQLGYVETVRGKSGGLRLGRRPEAITVGEIVRHMEPDMALVECFRSSEVQCRIVEGCVLRDALEEALDRFLGTLDGYTLADLLVPAGKLSSAFPIQLPDIARFADKFTER